MIEPGDEINFKAICINATDKFFLFALKGCPINENFTITLSETDMGYNQEVLDTLTKWKQPKEC